ncbi:MAG: N-acetyltransferase family protein [Actinomycetota bacterium]
MADDDPSGQQDRDPLTLAPKEWGRETELRDGTPVLLRQIRPEDRDRLVEGLARLSPSSRYLRFHADVERLTDRQIDYLTRVDHVEHEAIVALDLTRPDVPGIGVARYIRDAFERHVAEAAVTVADEYQGQGAGTLLLGALSARARRQGIEVFRNYVLASNQPMLEVFDDLGAIREQETDGLWRVDLPLPERASDLPDSPAGRAFMAAAKQGFRLSSLFPPVWSRLTSRHLGQEGAEGSTEEFALLRGELDAWLADREHRYPRWPGALRGGQAAAQDEAHDAAQDEPQDEPQDDTRDDA